MINIEPLGQPNGAKKHKVNRGCSSQVFIVEQSCEAAVGKELPNECAREGYCPMAHNGTGWGRVCAIKSKIIPLCDVRVHG